MKISKAHGQGDRAKSRELLFPQFGDNPLLHAVEPLGDYGGLRVSSAKVSCSPSDFRVHSFDVDTLGLLEQPLPPFAEPIGQDDIGNFAEIFDRPDVPLVQGGFALGADARNHANGKGIKNA